MTTLPTMKELVTRVKCSEDRDFEFMNYMTNAELLDYEMSIINHTRNLSFHEAAERTHEINTDNLIEFLEIRDNINTNPNFSKNDVHLTFRDDSAVSAITFTSNHEILKFSANGEVHFQGRLIGTDKEIFERLQQTIKF